MTWIEALEFMAFVQVRSTEHDAHVFAYIIDLVGDMAPYDKTGVEWAKDYARTNPEIYVRYKTLRRLGVL